MRVQKQKSTGLEGVKETRSPSDPRHMSSVFVGSLPADLIPLFLNTAKKSTVIIRSTKTEQAANRLQRAEVNSRPLMLLLLRPKWAGGAFARLLWGFSSTDLLFFCCSLSLNRLFLGSV